MGILQFLYPVPEQLPLSLYQIIFREQVYQLQQISGDENMLQYLSNNLELKLMGTTTSCLDCCIEDNLHKAAGSGGTIKEYLMMLMGRPARPFEMPMGEHGILSGRFRADEHIFHALSAQNMRTGMQAPWA
ncbi:unnamed protein product [Lupinus luteus]|uniref:Uncharacterized protein n=1 Tax=Lupinus luteus TaxID=3873 RepID=A0AAV1W3V0_LUPLU